MAERRRRPLTRYIGSAFCHVPAEERFEPERLARRDSADDRWNAPGEPTIYLAVDRGVALAELARHAVPERRRILRFEVSLDGLADLRDVAEGRPEGIGSIADRDRTRAWAASLRRDLGCRGLLVPSLAFPDDASRANLVVFAERLPTSIEVWLGDPVVVGEVDLTRDEHPAESRV